MLTKFVRSDATKTRFTWEILVATKNRELEGTGTNPTDTESKDENPMRTQVIEDLRRYNYLLDLALAVCDLDTFATHPDIFDNGEI